MTLRARWGEVVEDWRRIGMALDQAKVDAARHAGSHQVPTPPIVRASAVARTCHLGELVDLDDTAIPGEW